MRSRKMCPSKIRALFILCLLSACELISANSDAVCKKGCPESDQGLLQYAAGNVYVYNFDSVLTVSLGGSGTTDPDDTKLVVEGKARLFAEGNCGYTLQLDAVTVTAPKDSMEKKMLEHIQKPVHFTMVGGKVEPEICTDSSDSTYALNVKRGIISLFQSNAEAQNEVDIFGQCPTHTTVSKIDSTEIVTKVRNLNACAYREQVRMGILSGVVNDKAGVKSTTLLQADYSKEVKVEHGVIENVHLVEEYKFIGTPKVDTSVHARVVTILKIKNPAGVPAAAPATGNQVASIVFQKPDVYASKNIDALKAALGQAVQLVENYVQKNAGKQFVELIRLMRNADTKTLLELAAYPHPNKVLARKVYLDALFRTGTAQSARAIISQIGKMDDKEKQIAILSMNLVQSVDKETINQITGLLNNNMPKEIFLAVGNIVAKYCQQNGCGDADVEVVSKKFSDALKHCKANTKRDEERIVYALKGIRNTQNIASSAATAVLECSTAGRSNRIRVAALQAFSAAKCDSQLHQKALEILKEHNEDSEIRIEAYLAAVECPNAELGNQIAEIVNSENVNQVGGFIASNLKAIRDSTDVARESQRHFLANVRVTKKFPKDFRRYSFNDEISSRMDSLGVSSSSDYKLIYSQHGFLPRSARLNVSAEVFGTSFNVFEASIRQENLERILEYYMGPKGLLNKDLEEIVSIIHSGGDSVDSRGRRSIADDTTKFAKKYKTYGAKNMHDLNLDFSLKLFGSEMFFLSLGDNIPTSVDDLTKHLSAIYDNVRKGLSSFNKEFNMHSFFMDSDLIYATGVGMPLELSAQGFAASKLDVGIEFDLNSVLDPNWKAANYRLKLVPSVDINVNVQLGFNAYVLSTGTRVTSNLHSAMGSDTRFQFMNSGSSGFNLDIELPREKTQLIDLQLVTDLFVAEPHKNIKSIALKANQNHKQDPIEDCFNQFEFAGFSVCFITNNAGIGKSVSNDGINVEDFQLMQPFSFALYVTSERKFNLKMQSIDRSETGTQLLKLDYSTPGSKVSHDTTLALEFSNNINLPWKLLFIRASVDYPQHHMALEAGYKNNNEEAVLYGQYEYNQEVKRNRIGFVKNGNEYRPVIEIQAKKGIFNELMGYRADGRILLQQTNGATARYNFENLQVVSKDNARVVVNGWVDVGAASFKSELHVAPGQDSFFIVSHVNLENNEYSVGMFINDEKTPENVMGGSTHIKMNDNELNLDVTGKAGTWVIESNNAWKFQYNTDESIAPKITSSKFKNSLSVTNKNTLVGGFKLNGLIERDQKVDVYAEITRGKKIASVTMKVDSNQRTEGDYHIQMNGKLNNHFVDILATGDVKDNVFVINNVITTSWGTALTLKGEMGRHYTAQDIYISLQGTTQFSGKEKPTQWIIRINGTPDKTSSELRITRDNSELLKFIGELQHQADKMTTGKMNMQLKNTFIAKADIKTNKNGKGELNANLEMLKFEPKHKIEVSSKFYIQAPRYDLETVVTLDADKKVYWKTENIADKLKFSTKNTADIANKQFSFEANGLVKGEWRLNGEVQGSFAFTYPEERVISGSLRQKVTTNQRTGISQGNIDVKLSEQHPLGEVKRSLGLTAKLEKANLKAKEFALETDCIYTHHDGKKINLNYHLKHLPKGRNKMIDLVGSLRGDILKQSVDISLAVDEYSSKHANYRSAIQYGDQVFVNLNGNYNIGERGKPASYEIQSSVQIPQSTLKTIELNSHGKYLKPETEGGTYMTEIHFDEKAGNERFAKFNVLWKGSRSQGTYNMDVETEKMEGPFKVEGSFQKEQEVEVGKETKSGKQKYAFNYNYAGKYAKATSDISFTGETISVHYIVDSSFDMLKDIDVQMHGEKLDPDSYMVKMDVKQAESAYAVESKYFGSKHKKGLDIHATLPNGKPIVFVGIFELLSQRKVKLTVDVDNLAGLDLKGLLEASYETIENFYIVGQCKSVKLNLDDVALDVRSQGQIIAFNLKNAQGVIAAGNATYVLKKEKNKSILEGQGQLQYKGKSQNTNFKLIRQQYELEADKEVGFSYTLNGNFGPKNGVSTLKMTNKDFNVKFSVCEEKKQCTNIQVQSILTVNEKEIGSSHHSLLVLVDLRELGYPHEFELQSKIMKQGFKSQYSLHSNIISNSNMKYQLAVNVLPNSCMVNIKLPTREMLLEMRQTFPRQGELFGHYENSMVIYLDKTKNPNDRTRLVASADINGVKRASITANGEIKFEHPTIRPLSISGKIDANTSANKQSIANVEVVFDIFRVPEQKVVLTSHIQNTETEKSFNITSRHSLQSTGLGFQYDINGQSYLNTELQEFSAAADLHCGATDMNADINVNANRNRIEVLMHVLKKQVVHMLGEFNRQKGASKFDSKLQILGQKPLHLTADIHASSAKFSVKRNGLLDANAEVKLGKEANFKIVGAGKPLCSGRVALDAAKFMQVTYENNADNIKTFLEIVEIEAKKDTDVFREQMKKRFQKMRDVIDRQIQLAEGSLPDFSQLKANYVNNANEIVNEIESDPSAQEIFDAYRKMYTTIARIVADTAKTSAESYEKLHKSVVALYTAIEVVIRDTVLPMWEGLSTSLADVLSKIGVDIVNLHTYTVQFLLNILEKCGPALKSYGKLINESLEPFHEAAQELYKIIAHAREEVLNELKEHFSKLPTFDALRDDLKQKLENMKLSENALKFVNDLFEQAQILPQTPETGEFLQMLHKYITAKLKQQEINDEKFVEELLALLEKALRSILATLPVPMVADSIPSSDFRSLFTLMSYSMDLYRKLPMLLSVRFSVINFLLTENLENVFSRDILVSGAFFNGFDLKGHVADGRHIFTFDGMYITFPGSCKYILAQDSVDNNFTVVAHLNNGRMKSIILTDRDGAFMEINDAGVLKVNGSPKEFPHHESGMHAWRQFYTVWMISEYGVQVMCTSDLKVCHVDVNGFYTSKTRGLLGNGNAEPNDDLLQIDGTIAANHVSFVNGYGIGKCNPLSSEEPTRPEQTELCNEIFGIDSPLSFGFLFINHAPFRTACDNAVLAAADKDKELAACTIAMAYGSALNMEGSIVSLPSRCLKCPGAAGQRDLGHEFTTKTPNTKADLVFVVDTDVTPDITNLLVSPVITDMREALKARGLTDVQIAVIVYNKEQRYPALITSDNGKLNYHAKFGEVKLNGPKNFCSACSQVASDKRVLQFYELLESIIKSILPQSDEKAFRMALNYPFRAEAAKTIISVRSDSLGHENLVTLTRALITSADTNFDGAILHAIGPVHEMSLEGVPAEKLVGFNSRLVATLDGKDNKKRPKLQFRNDMGIEFVLDNGGWIFATQNFDKLKPDEQKKALNQVTNTIADSLFKTEVVSECKCVPVHGLHAQHKCEIKSSTFVPNKKPKVRK